MKRKILVVSVAISAMSWSIALSSLHLKGTNHTYQSVSVASVNMLIVSTSAANICNANSSVLQN
jgi:hypothetical protein